MKKQSEKTVSLWMATCEPPQASSLSQDLATDVCVIGAGIAGLTTAYLLAKEGRRVVVLDQRHVCAGQTQRTTAHLTNAHDNFYSEVEKIHGFEGIRIAAASHTAAINRIEKIVRTEQIDCDFQRLPGFLFCGSNKTREFLETEWGAATRAGIEGLEIVGRVPLATFDTGPAIRYPAQGQFHPLKYLSHLTKSIQASGGLVFSGTPVKQVKDGSPVTVETAIGPHVKASAVVVATNSPINDMYAIHTKQAPYLTYAIACPLARGMFPSALMWDTESPYHYVRTQPLNDHLDLLIVGGEDHKAGQVSDQAARHDRLEEWAKERFPAIEPPVYRWSGMVMETTDGGAFIGKNPGEKNVYIATGDSGMGMTHGTIAGMLLSDLICGRSNDWASFYDPSRKPVAGGALGKFVSENANVGYEYVRDWAGWGDEPDVHHLENDQGTVVRRGLSLVAVYRNSKGNLHEHSAVCPHLGCIVHWNNLEKVWDCPCHGSRFDANGQVICGPAISPLGPADAMKKA